MLLCLAAVVLPLLLLAILVGDVLIDGAARLSLGFLTAYPSRRAAAAGILPSLVGSFSLITMTALIAMPIGVGAAIYLEEYEKRGRLASIIEINIANLAGVPSIIYGLLGLGIFVRTLGLGRSLLAGALTMALLVLPVVIMASREALRTVPHSIREASYALGATRWQTIRQVVLPMALPGILTGAILATSRAVGETAPLIVIGALTYVTFLPDGPSSPFTVLPIQIFNWVSRPQQEFLANAAAGILVLLALMLLLNLAAILIRNRLQRRLA
jgi:phosphate transport system permease protein